ncbi:MAG TPA: hypothetical protein VMH81_14110 [Bryobacteraceae bacterium]|nr:hypothetical protein [Bryobacteraceae bacterium]
MSWKSARFLMTTVLGIGLMEFGPGAFSAWAQNTNGSVAITVLDATGASVPGALLEIQDIATNDTHWGGPQG